MKLVFIIDSTRNIGGGDFAQFYFAKALAKKGHEVVVFARDTNFFSPELEGVNNLIVRYYHSIPVFAKKIGIGLLNSFWGRIHTFFVTKPFIKQWKPDWIIGYLRGSAIRSVCLGKKTNVKTANFIFETPPWMEHDIPTEWKEELKQRKFRKSWEKTRKAYSESDVLIPNSKLSGDMCKKWISSATIGKPAYPGIDISTVNKITTKRIYDFVYVGRLNALKNVNELLRAASQLEKKTKILIMGSGEELPSLTSLAEELSLNVTFTGTVSESKKWELLQKSKVLVFPTSHEGFGMPPLEAFACGCDVICSDLAIFKEVYGKTVHTYPLHNVKQLASVMEDVLKGKKKRSKNASLLVEKYTWENAVLSIEKTLEKYS